MREDRQRGRSETVMGRFNGNVYGGRPVGEGQGRGKAGVAIDIWKEDEQTN